MSGKKKPTKTNIFDKYKLREIDKKIIEYVLSFPKITHEEIATLTNKSRLYITERLNTPIVKQALKELEGNWIEKLLNAKEKAAKKIIKHIDNPNPAISIRACEQILQLDKLDLSNTNPEAEPY